MQIWYSEFLQILQYFALALTSAEEERGSNRTALARAGDKMDKTAHFKETLHTYFCPV